MPRLYVLLSSHAAFKGNCLLNAPLDLTFKSSYGKYAIKVNVFSNWYEFR